MPPPKIKRILWICTIISFFRSAKKCHKQEGQSAAKNKGVFRSRIDPEPPLKTCRQSETGR